jgi:iron complex outermembrane receptor protein
MHTHRKRLLASTVIAGVVAIAPTVWAQDADNNNERQEESATKVTDVVVTGSRIRRNEFTSSQPIQVITSEQASLEGTVDTAELLQSSTAASTATQINNFFTGYVVTGGAGVNTISLRGLGANRTLVLVNGRRAGPAGVSGTVGPTDLNTIPSSQIERVEILTDGASSIYGSDAVAGVVNIITKTNQDGGNFQAFASIPVESGGEEYRVNASHGWTTDRGYLTLGADYYERKALLFGDRDMFACPQDRVYYDENLNIRADLIDPATGDYKCSSSINAFVRANRVIGGAYRSFDFAPDTSALAGGGFLGCNEDGWRFQGGGAGTACATTTQSTADRRALASTYPMHSDRYDSRTAVSPVTRASISAFAGYDLTPDIEIFGEFLFNRRESEQNSWRQLFPNVFIGAPNYPFEAVTALGLTNDYALPIAHMNMDAEQQVDYTRVVAGIRGTLNIGRGWDWELAGQFSRSDAKYGNNFFYADRVYATSGYHQGKIVDGVTIIPPAFASGANRTEFWNTGCVTAWLTTAASCPTGGVNWFSTDYLVNGQLTPEEAAFLIGWEEGTTRYDHAYIEGVISGELFDLPAGPLGVALGFQVRKEKLDDQPGAQAQASNSWGLTTAGRTRGEDTVKELFLEFDAPLIRNAPLVDSLTLNVSGRYSDYDSYGENSTYKAGLNWAITPEYRIRTSYGTAFRAPALYELYLANQTSYTAQTGIDPCINWGESTDAAVRANCEADGVPEDYTAAGRSSAMVIAGGGRGVLEAETADTLSAGFIWTPSFSDLSVALDYYKVTIKDQVSRFGSANILRGCYGAGGYQDSSLCGLFDRAPAGATNEYQITTVRDSYINIAEQMSEGLDLNVRYRKEFSAGDLTLTARASYILDWTYQLRSASQPSDQLDYIGYPDWTANLGARFDRGDWTVYWNVDLVPETTNVRSANTVSYYGETLYLDTTAEAVQYHSLSVRKKMDKWTIQVGVNNLFNENAPWTSYSGGSRGAGNVPLTSQYDYIGRRAFLTLTRDW